MISLSSQIMASMSFFAIFIILLFSNTDLTDYTDIFGVFSNTNLQLGVANYSCYL